jgi:hypothetical protein
MYSFVYSWWTYWPKHSVTASQCYIASHQYGILKCQWEVVYDIIAKGELFFSSSSLSSMVVYLYHRLCCWFLVVVLYTHTQIA